MTVYVYDVQGKPFLTLAPEVDVSFWRSRGADVSGGWAYPSIALAARGRFTPPPRADGIYMSFTPGLEEKVQEYLASVWTVWHRRLGGRSLLFDEVRRWLAAHEGAVADAWLKRILQYGVLRGDARLLPAIRTTGGEVEWQCERCQSGRDALRRTACARCRVPCMYCDYCLHLGRSRSCEPLFQFTAPHHRFHPSRERITSTLLSPEVDKLSLTPAQQRAAEAARAFVAQGTAPVFLIWAVTGSGKTEMTFETVKDVLARGRRVAVATPRRDVVEELAPRFREAFPSVRTVKLHGESGETWADGQLVVATTHQLLRWYRAFHLIVVDEVDAFPYRHDKRLQAGVERALAVGGQQLWLTATPPLRWQKAFRRGRLPGVTVPVRHHGHPLPEPQLSIVTYIKRKIQSGVLLAPLDDFFRHVQETGGQAYVFVPGLSYIPPVVQWLRKYFPSLPVAGVSSSDSRRADKIAQFRNGVYRCLVTTTILERGVTVPHAHVLVLQADHPVFDEAALIQMSGRSGRSSAFPTGRVMWVAAVRTEEQRRALRGIQAMNREAASLGWLK